MIGEFISYASSGMLSSPIASPKSMTEYMREKMRGVRIEMNDTSQKVRAFGFFATVAAMYGPVSADEAAQFFSAIEAFAHAGENPVVKAIAAAAACAAAGFGTHFAAGELARHTVTSNAEPVDDTTFDVTGWSLAGGTIAEVIAAKTEGKEVTAGNVAKSAGIIAAINGTAAGVLALGASSSESLTRAIETDAPAVGVGLVYAAYLAMSLRDMIKDGK